MGAVSRRFMVLEARRPSVLASSLGDAHQSLSRPAASTNLKSRGPENLRRPYLAKKVAKFMIDTPIEL